MNELQFLLNQLAFNEGDGGGDDKKPADPKQDDTDSGKGDESNESAFKSFASEEEYNNTLKSERSKAKNEVLKELGVNKLEEAKQKISATDEVSKDLASYKSKVDNLEQDLALKDVGIKDEFKDDALTLAKARMSEGKNLTTALGEVVERMPNMASQKEGVKKMGADKGKGKDDDASTAQADKLKRKYPWLKL